MSGSDITAQKFYRQDATLRTGLQFPKSQTIIYRWADKNQFCANAGETGDTPTSYDDKLVCTFRDYLPWDSDSSAPYQGWAGGNVTTYSSSGY